MVSVHNVDLYLNELERAHQLVKHAAEQLKQQFEELIAPSLRIGTVIDTSALGQAYNAFVQRGRGYGFHFRIESKVTVEVEVSRPSMSRWALYAISVDPTDHSRTLGKQVWLTGKVFPAHLTMSHPKDSEHHLVMDCVGKLMEREIVHG